MNKVEQASQYIDLIRVKSNEALLFLSLGKDSLVLLDLIYPKFDRIVCVFMYFVKNLEHINRWINWTKAKYPKIEFVQVPHWNLTYILRGGMYCVPNPKVKLLKLADVVKAMQLTYGLYYTFLGMKKADGMNRRLMLKGYEVNGYENNGMVYPLADWTQKDILAYMRQHNLPEPVRYSLKASSGVGFNLDCMLWMENNYPQDLQRIYKVFPMAERVLWEYNNQQKQQKESRVRRKSIDDIAEQRYRLSRTLTGNRLNRVNSIARKYIRYIERTFGYNEGKQQDGARKVSRRIYMGLTNG